MADIIARFKGDTSDLDSKIKKASGTLLQMERDCRKVGDTLAIVEKEQLEYVRALGQMETKSATTKGKMRELTQAATDLTAMFRRMSDEEKKSEFGQALNSSISQLIERAGAAKDAMADVSAAITNVASDTRGFDQMAGAMTTATSAFQVGQGAAKLLGIELGDNVEILAKLQAAMAITNGLQVIQNNLQKQSALMQGLNGVKTTLAATAQGLYAVATGNATAAQTAFNTAAAANPYGAILAVVGLAAGAVAMFTSKTESATQAINKQAEEAKKLAERHKSMASVMNGATQSVLSKFISLQVQWKSLRTEAEKTQWIKNNQSAFNSMGLAINNVNDANRVFITQANQVVAALIKIALAQKAADKYAEVVINNKDKQYRRQQGGGSVSTGEYYTKADKSNLTDAEHQRLIDEGYYKSYGLGSKEAMAQVNKWRQQEAASRRKAVTDSEAADEAFYKKLAEDAQRGAIGAQDFLNSLGVANYNTGSGGGGRGGGRGGGGTSTPKTPKTISTSSFTQLQVLQDQLKTVQNSMAGYGKNTEEWKAMNEEAKSLADQIARINGDPLKLVETSSLSQLQIMEDQLATIKASMQNATYSEEWKEMADEAERMEKAIKNFKGETDPKKQFSLTDNKYYQGATAAVGGVGQIGEGLKGMGIELGKGFEKTLGVVQGIFTVIEGVQAIISAIQLFQSANDTVQTGLLSAISFNTGVMATASAIKTVPIIGEFLHAGGIVHAAQGVFVPGAPNGGRDTVPAMLSPGELVLNMAQQNSLASQLQQGNVSGMHLSATIKGEDIRLALNNNSRRRGRGEYVTTR